MSTPNTVARFIIVIHGSKAPFHQTLCNPCRNNRRTGIGDVGAVGGYQRWIIGRYEFEVGIGDSPVGLLRGEIHPVQV